MGIIRQLPPSLINQIAAGEVVERPASAVKELLENAVDAGATRIDLETEQGGRQLIRVSDDGCGMLAEDLPLAFTSHATSKIAGAEDLLRIRTLGFRGEALAAIAEVSQLRVQSRVRGQTGGAELEIDGGRMGAVRVCGCPEGTVMEVRNLFFNVPARRKFLKTPATEAGHVTDVFTRIALAEPGIHLTLQSAGKRVYDLPATSELGERVALFFGRELAESLIAVESEVGRVRLKGFVAHPSQSRANNKMQFVFLNGRYIRDRSLQHALSEAYRGLLLTGRYPIAILALEVPPEEVDVNVHPTKIEVRFRDSSLLYSQVLSTLRHTFLRSDLNTTLRIPAPSVEQDKESAEGGNSLGSAVPDRDAERAQIRRTIADFFRPPPAASAETPEAERAPWEDLPASPPAAKSETWSLRIPTPPLQQSFPPTAPNAPLSAAEKLPNGAGSRAAEPGNGRGAGPLKAPAALPLKAIQLHDSYLVAETLDGMVVIDQHALHERILYEELRLRLADGAVESQRLLVPDTIELSPAEVALILEHREVLATLGLNVEAFGGETVALQSYPAMLAQGAPERLLRDIIDHLQNRGRAPSREELTEDLLHMVACKAAVKAGQPLTPEEIAALLQRRQLAQDSHHCPHGRPTALVFTKDELEKQFRRK